MSTADSTILIVDDAVENILVLNEPLANDYGVRFATSGPDALKIVEEGGRDYRDVEYDSVLVDNAAYQLVVDPTLDDASFSEHHYLLRLTHGRDTVADDERGTG